MSLIDKPHTEINTALEKLKSDQLKSLHQSLVTVLPKLVILNSTNLLTTLEER